MRKIILFVILLLAVGHTVLASSISDLKSGGILEPDFMMYGITDADLAPITDYLTLLKENGIFLKLPNLTVNDRDEDDWIYTRIGKSIYLTYQYFRDGSEEALWMEFPMNYKPKDHAHVLLIESMLSIDRESAEQLFNSLKYNLIDGRCEISTETYALVYYEIIGPSEGIQTLIVKRYK